MQESDARSGDFGAWTRKTRRCFDSYPRSITILRESRPRTCSPYTRWDGTTKRSTTRSRYARCSISTIAGSMRPAFMLFLMRRIERAESVQRDRTVMSASSAQIPVRAEIYRGWLVVLAAFFGVMVSFGSMLVFTFSVFLKPLSAEFGWSRESISTAFGIAAMTVAVCSPPLGRLLDRYGPRPVILPCMVVFGFAFTVVIRSDTESCPSLYHLPCARSGWKRDNADGLFPSGVNVVHSQTGNRSGVGSGWSWSRLDGLPEAGPKSHRCPGMAFRLRGARSYHPGPGCPADRSFCLRTTGNEDGSASCSIR